METQSNDNILGRHRQYNRQLSLGILSHKRQRLRHQHDESGEQRAGRLKRIRQGGGGSRKDDWLRGYGEGGCAEQDTVD